jgi:hypothetical protein
MLQEEEQDERAETEGWWVHEATPPPTCVLPPPVYRRKHNQLLTPLYTLTEAEQATVAKLRVSCDHFVLLDPTSLLALPTYFYRTYFPPSNHHTLL